MEPSTWPLMLGIGALVALVVGVGVVLLYATRQARAEQGPISHPGDFVAPVSSGGYRWRKPDESTEEFRARVGRESEPPKA